MDDRGPVSIVTPTYREANNIEPLVKRIAAAMAATARRFEIIIVDDDSRDGTVEWVETLATAHPVRVIVRKGERGLSGAVVDGLRQAKFDRLVVIDADLQHPPEALVPMLAALDEDAVEFVIGTRYAGAGSVSAKWPWWRRLGSRVATALARPLATVSDPMSGYFALRREVWSRAAQLIDPIGYKIGLEILVKGRCRRVREVPIAFESRHAGTSKAGVGVMLRYLQHLCRLYRFQYPKLAWGGAAVVVILLTAMIVGTLRGVR
jgi:dolichol-phosphate mannosyltransferase